MRKPGLYERLVKTIVIEVFSLNSSLIVQIDGTLIVITTQYTSSTQVNPGTTL